MASSCVDPGKIQGWELQAYADGEELPHVQEHLSNCQACRTELKENAQLERSLRRSLYRLDCPSVDRLRDFWWSYLPDDEGRQLQQHVDSCPHCVAELDELSEFATLERTEPGNTLLARARQMADQVRLVVASLIPPDSGLAWALRGETKEVLLFDAADLAVSINLEQEETGTFTLFGQILSSEPLVFSGGYARLTARERAVPPSQVPLEANGGFVLTDLHPDFYQLLVSLPDRRILVPYLALKAEL